MEAEMELQYTYWQEPDGWYIGYFDDFPDHPTQGETMEELEVMLKDLYDCLELSKYHKAKLRIA
jgi:predicted RNase H-like HicB family nuclease